MGGLHLAATFLQDRKNAPTSIAAMDFPGRRQRKNEKMKKWKKPGRQNKWSPWKSPASAGNIPVFRPEMSLKAWISRLFRSVKLQNSTNRLPKSAICPVFPEKDLTFTGRACNLNSSCLLQQGSGDCHRDVGGSGMNDEKRYVQRAGGRDAEMVVCFRSEAVCRKSSGRYYLFTYK